MTDKTEDDKFAEAVAEQLPPSMSTENVVGLCYTLLTSYAADMKTAGTWLAMLTRVVVDHYRTDTDGECMCDACVAERKRNIN